MSNNPDLFQSKLEKRFDTEKKQITIDPTLTDKVTQTLILLNAPSLVISEASLAPPAGATSTQGESFASGETTLWGIPATTLTMTFQGEGAAQKVGVQASLPSLDFSTISQHIMPLDTKQIGALTHISFDHADVRIAADSNELTINAGANHWGNFLGFDGIGISDLALKLTSHIGQGGWQRDSQARLTGTLKLKNSTIPIEIGLPVGLQSWRLRILPPGIALPSLTDIADLMLGTAVVAALPPEVGQMTALTLADLDIQFDPQKPSLYNLSFSITTTNRWEYAANLTLAPLNLAIHIYPTGQQSGSAFAFYGYLSGSASIGHFNLSASVPIPFSGPATLQISAKQPLDNLADLAELIGGTDLAASLPDGLHNALGLELRNLTLSFDLAAKRVLFLGVDVVTEGEWSIIPDHLSVEGIELRLNAAARDNHWGVTGLVAGSINIEGTWVSIAVERLVDRWTLRLSEALLLPGVAQLAYLVGGSYLDGFLPDGMSNDIGELDLQTFKMDFDPINHKLSSIAIEITTENDWVFLPGYLTLESLLLSLSISQPADSRQRQVTGLISGVIALGDAPVIMKAQKTASSFWTFEGGLVPGTTVSLSKLVADLLPASMALPSEVADLSISDLAISITPHTGACMVTGKSSATWDLPFGVSGLAVSTVELAVQRGPATGSGDQEKRGRITCTLKLHGAGPITIVDGLIFKSIDFTFDLNQQAQSWALSGTVSASILGVDTTFAASLNETPTLRTITLQVRETASVPLIDLGEVGSLTGKDLSIIISKALQPAANAAVGGISLQAGSAYTWSVQASGGVTLTAVFTLNGTLALSKTPTGASLVFKPTIAQVNFNLPDPLQSWTTHLGLEYLSFASSTDSQGKRSWIFDTTVSVWLSGLPARIQAIVPSEKAKTTAHFKADSQEVTLGVDQLIPAQDFKLPTTKVAGRDLDLGTALVEATNLQLRLGHSIALAANFGIGLPQGLNTIFGVKDDGSPAVQLFNTYQAGKNDTITKFQLALDGTTGLQVQVATSPIEKIVIVTEGQDRWCYADMGSFGAVKFLVPVFSFSEGRFNSRGSFTQTRELKLPLTPLKWLLTACGLSAAANKLPAGLPLRELKIYDSAANHFNSAALIQMLVDAGIPLNNDIKNALQLIEGQLDQLPDRFKNYLDIVIPKSFSFEIALSTDGRFQGSVAVDKSTPIKLLYSVLGPLGPQLNGIEFYGFTLGELLNGSLLLINIDCIIDQFDLPTLISALALPLDKLPILPRTQDLSTTTIIRNLFMLIIYESIIPIPVPLFFDQLGLDYMGLPGLGIHTHWNFPKPHLSTSDASTLFSNFERFFTDHNYLLDTGKPPQNLDLVLTIGPNYIQLPQYLGGETLGSKTDTTVISAYENLAHLLNALKRLSLNELIQVIPPIKRSGKEQITFACMTLEADWLITTLQEFRAGSYTQLGIGAADVDTVARVLPPSPRQDGQGVALFFKGRWMPIEGATLDACISLLGTEAGFSTGMRIAGTITNLLDVELTGSVVISSSPADAFDLTGASHLRIFNDTIFNGSLRLSDKNFAIDGDLDLFPQSTILRITGHISGHFSNTELLISGSATATFGSGFTLASGSANITSTGVTLSGTWLNQTVVFSAQKVDGALQLHAMLSRIEIGDAFKVTDATGNSGPLAQLGISAGNPSLFLSGSIYLLGIQSTTVVNFTSSGFSIVVEGKVFSLYEATVQATGVDLVNGGTFTVNATLKDDGFFSALASACGSVLKEGSDEASSKLSDAKTRVEGARTNVNGLNDKITARTQQLQQQLADAQGKLKSARDGVTAAQKQVDDITGQLATSRQNAQARLNNANSQLSSYQAQVYNAQNNVNSLQNRINALQQDINRRFPLDPQVTADGLELAGLYTAFGTAQGTLRAASATLATVRSGLDLTPVEADPTVVALEGQQRAYITGLNIAQGTLAGAQATVQNFPSVDLDPQIIALRGSLTVAQAGLDGANLSLSGAQKASDAYGQVGTYIAQNGLSGLVSVKGARFNGVLDAVKDATVTFSVDVQFAGRAQVQTYTIMWSLRDVLGAAKALANELVPT